MRRLKRPYMRHGIMLPPIHEDISGERLDGTFPIYRHGYNVSIAASTWETVYAAGALYTWPGAAAQLDILSDNVNDDGNPPGNGARTVYIWGLNGSFRPISETVTLNGMVAVQTTNSYLRVQGIRIATTGTFGRNIGNISVQDLGNTYTLCYMVASMGRQNGAIWTVPEGKTLYITDWMVGEYTGNRTEFVIYGREPGGVFKAYCYVHVNNQSLHMPFTCPLRFDEKTDIQVFCQPFDQGVGGFAAFQGWYEPSEGNLTQDR